MGSNKLLGSDKYFTIEETNIGPKDIEMLAKENMKIKEQRRNEKISGFEDRSDSEKLELWDHYEK